MARGAAAIALLALATAAPADVKTGADAWGRGDYAAAVREWQDPAEKGDPDARFNLGQAYRLGRGVPRDLTRAEALFGKAAAQGHLQAADNYGLLMFDRGERAAALPYIRAAAERGDPRAQYLMGIAHFNGDLAAKDWTRAYALMSLAQGAGLPQAAPALAQMDQNIPLPQRQAAAALAPRLAQQAQARRAAQLASADLATPDAITRPAQPRTTRSARAASAATAGADYASPAAPAAAARPVKAAVALPAPSRPAPVAAAGKWRVQLGAFGRAANADGLWARVKARPELSGRPRLNVPAGKVTKLQAGGFADRAAASAACTALGKAGFTCIPVQD